MEKPNLEEYEDRYGNSLEIGDTVKNEAIDGTLGYLYEIIELYKVYSIGYAMIRRISVGEPHTVKTSNLLWHSSPR
jgi:hypothetical protein